MCPAGSKKVQRCEGTKVLAEWLKAGKSRKAGSYIAPIRYVLSEQNVIQDSKPDPEDIIILKRHLS
jgi:hypothetical protein